MPDPRISAIGSYVPTLPTVAEKPVREAVAPIDMAVHERAMQLAVARHDVQELDRLPPDRITANALLTSLEKACQDKSCPFAIKRALLGLGLVDRQRALDLAIRHDDIELAEELVKQGCIPRRPQLQRGSDDMRVLLTRAHRRALLYPPGTDRGEDTALDRALQADEVAQAKALLLQEMGDANVRTIWRQATSGGRNDVLRALLLLGMADQDRGFRLEEEPGTSVEDAGVSAVIKEMAHHSPKARYRAHPNFHASGSRNTDDQPVHPVQSGQAAKPAANTFFQESLALHEALRNGDTADVQTYRNRLPLMSEADCMELLAAGGPDGTSGLALALRNKHPLAIRAYCALLLQVPEEGRGKLVNAEIVMFALQHGDADTIEAFSLLLRMIPQAQRARLLSEAARALPGAMKSGNTALVDAYSSLCMEVAPSLSRQQRADLRKKITLGQRPRFKLSQMPPMRAWSNFQYYDQWKNNHPDSYQRFKAMKTALKT